MAFGSMWVGATGMVAHGDKMQVVSNNIANVNTIAYKSGRTNFQDLVYQAQGYSGADENGTGGAINQIGKGVGIASVYTEFNQGSITDGSEPTDLAISGKGFFEVVNPEDDSVYYTRAGNFRFDKNGFLVDTNQYQVQGFPIDPDTGTLGDAEAIHLPLIEETNAYGETVYTVKSDPQATSAIEMIMNLDSDIGDQTVDAENPFFALAETWQASNTEDTGLYGYQNSIAVWDSAGEKHNLTVTFDQVTQSNTGNKYWEYIVTIPPEEDGRTTQNGVPEGLLMTGTLTFNAAGDLIDQSAYTPNGSSTASNSDLDLASWSPASFSADGVPVLNVAFENTYASNGQTYTTETQSISMDFGISSSTSTWTNGESTAADVGSNAGNMASMQGAVVSAPSTTSYSSSSATLTQSQDGYGTGYMSSMEVDSDGTLILNFSNGQHEDIYKLDINTFTSEYGLYRAGGNLFKATAASGGALSGVAGEDGRGSILGQSLEASNVDLADQFARMILTQRGFQANSKVITTSDSMLSTATSMKR